MRDPDLDGARLETPSLKLDGGAGALDRFERFTERESVPWNIGICCTRDRSACSGVCARKAELLKEGGLTCI